MHPPCELMMGNFLPSMRALVAGRLREDGYSQSKIAGLLGLTQASVSLYLSRDSAAVYQSLEKMAVAREEADRYSSLLAEDLKKNPAYATATLYAIWAGLLGRGLMCRFHRTEHPALATCDVCMKTFAKEGGSQDAIEQVSRAVGLIESSPSFVGVMPNVSVNIAYSPGDPRSPDDVIAIPGRIVKVRNSPRSFSRPEYGASSHLARILLVMRKRRKDVFAAMNIRYDARIARTLRRLRIRSLVAGGTYPEVADDPVVKAFEAKLAVTKEPFDAFVDAGGFGLEPSLYLFGKDAVEVADLAIRISSELPREKESRPPTTRRGGGRTDEQRHGRLHPPSPR